MLEATLKPGPVPAKHAGTAVVRYCFGASCVNGCARTLASRKRVFVRPKRLDKTARPAVKWPENPMLCCWRSQPPQHVATVHRPGLFASFSVWKFTNGPKLRLPYGGKLLLQQPLPLLDIRRCSALLLLLCCSAAAWRDGICGCSGPRRPAVLRCLAEEGQLQSAQSSIELTCTPGVPVLQGRTHHQAQSLWRAVAAAARRPWPENRPSGREHWFPALSPKYSFIIIL